MKKVITYISDDGMEFTDEHECFNHEFHILYRQYSKNLIFYDEKFNVIDKNDYDILNSCHYVYLGDKEAIKAAKMLYEEYGYILPEYEGYFQYDWENDKWISLTKNLAHFYACFKDAKKKIETMKEKI